MRLVGTRDSGQKVSLKEALLNPGSNYGGLFSPKKLPKFDGKFFKKALKLSYEELALKIIKSFDFDIDEKIFKKALSRYKNFDSKKSPVKIKKIGKNLYINELYHGPTRAFKDMALQPFGELLSHLAKDEKYLIICATSGDTGPATLNAFKDLKNIKVICLYPEGKTSQIQKLQMTNIKGDNLKSIGIKGNFDDAQNALKNLLNDKDFKDELNKSGIKLSAANSVNFGRILFQIIYHFYAYIWLLKKGIIKEEQKFNIVVPSGNFGNALGAYYAKKMGAKIEKIKIASNENNILTEFFNTGVYDLRDKKLIKTMSPAMDILLSSNIERLIFDKLGDKKTKKLMSNLAENRKYKVDKKILNGFEAKYCTDKECAKFIKKYAQKGILIDPHTATCFKFKPKAPTIITSTAHWAKFTPSMVEAIKDKKCINEKNEMMKLSKEFKSEIPKELLELFDSKVIHKDVVEIKEIKKAVLDWTLK